MPETNPRQGSSGMATSRHAGCWAAEFLVVSVSILAAFAVEEYRDDRAREELEAVALSNIRAEIEANLVALDAVMPYHEEISSSIGEYLADPVNWRGRAGFEVGAAVAPRGVDGGSHAAPRCTGRGAGVRRNGSCARCWRSCAPRWNHPRTWAILGR